MAVALTFGERYYLAGRNTTKLCYVFHFIVVNPARVDKSTTSTEASCNS